MNMLDNLSTVTSSTVAVALDALALRQQLVAGNLANANSAQATTYRIDFEEALREAESLSELRDVRREVNAGAFIKESPATAVEIDQQMIQLNETVIRYQALIQGLGKYGSLARMAISGEIR